MPGTALVTINENQWEVDVASTYSELIQGLSGVSSLAAGTGMLFILPSAQVVTVDTSQMLFPIDIIFIKDNAVLSIASNISPGYSVEEATPIDSFLEVNALEAELVKIGDVVSVELLYTILNGGISDVVSFAIPLALLGFVGAMIGSMFGLSRGDSSSKQLSSSGSNNPKVTTKEGYYIKIVRGLGIFKEEEVGRFSTHKKALDRLWELSPGHYTLVTFWDGKQFDRNSFKIDDGGEVFIHTFDGWLSIKDWDEYLHSYVYPRAVADNEFYTKEQRGAARRTVDKYIEEHREMKHSIHGEPRRRLVE